jgi:hypothetical protein
MRTTSWLRRTLDKESVRTPDKDLWWVRVILNVGRPVVAVFVLVMCAPGEHYLALQAGWSERLAWGMPGTLTAYAGIAAVVATKRGPNAPGHATAVWGAVVSIVLAMAAQPVAHLYGRVGLTQEQVTLTVVVSCIPALVFGHLLHMAAVRSDKSEDTGADTGRVVPQDTGQDTDTESVPADEIRWFYGQDTARTQDTSDAMRWMPDTDVPEDTRTVSEPTYRIVPKSAPRVRRTSDGSAASVVRDLYRDNPDLSDAEVRAAVLDKLPDTKPDNLRKAIARNRPAA